MLMSALALHAAPELTPAQQTAAFQAAGFQLQDGLWRQCDDPGTLSYSPGVIEQVMDLNADGRPEVLISEGSVFCHGMTGMGYSLVSQQGDGSWKAMAGGTGIVAFLPSKGVDGWPDIEVGGPGFCFPWLRWNGREYALAGYQYEGKRCQP